MSQAHASRIAVAPDRDLGPVDRKVFGGFGEHLGRCVYGGLYEEGSPVADERGGRTDVLGLLRELRLGVLRWPAATSSATTTGPTASGRSPGAPAARSSPGRRGAEHDSRSRYMFR